MRSFLTLLAALSAAFATPIETSSASNKIKDQWLVKLRDGASSQDLQNVITSMSNTFGTSPMHVYDFGPFKGFSMRASVAVPNALDNDDNVILVEQDQVVKINTLTTQQDPPYGLARISHREKGANTYVYDSSAGEGTYAYIIDTGIYAEHNDFEGRATFAANFADDDDRDVNGHGTHVAGTIGSKTYGVAKKTNLIGIKALGGPKGQGSFSNVLAGLDWAVRDAKNNSRIEKSVANLSLGGEFSTVINAAIRAVVDQGLFVAIAAGNEATQVKNVSPASAVRACTVAAIDENDIRPEFSNYGPRADVFAPGVFVKSTYIGGPDNTAVLSGTSMSTPHVAGLGAYLLGLGYGGTGGDELCTAIKKLSTKKAVSDPKSSPNRIAFNGGGGGEISALGARWSKREARKEKDKEPEVKTSSARWAKMEARKNKGQ